MKKHVRSYALGGAIVAMIALASCGGASDEPNADQAGAEHEEMAESNRLAIPSSVRTNIGITFVTVERRRIEKTLRVPGRFEYLPTARREYSTVLPGRVEMLVKQFERVEAGTPLYRIDSPAWRKMQQELAHAVASVERLSTRLESFGPLLAAHKHHQESLEESVEVWVARVRQLDELREAGGGRLGESVEAYAALASARAELSSVQEKDAELKASRAETAAGLRAARASIDLLLASASSIVDVPRAALLETVETPDGPQPSWRTIGTLEIRAAEPGVVELLGLTNGAWADEKTVVLSVARPDMLRFRASGLQSDLGVLRDGLAARIVPPTPTKLGRAIPLTDTMSGRLSLGLGGDANDRTIDIYVTPDELTSWARPGVSAQLEIVTDSSASPELAIPLAAVQRDGLVPVIFRRAPDNPNEAIRMEADLGMDDGRWIVLLSGVRDGDEIVLDGAFQLMLAMSGSIQKGGHFHTDGTFHAGEH